MARLSLLAALVASAACAGAAPLPRGIAVVADPIAALAESGKGVGGLELSLVAVEGQPFAMALRLKTLRRPRRVYDIQIRARNTAAVRKGDVLLATFWVRAVAPAKAHTEFIFELGRQPYTKSAQHPVVAGRKWQRIGVPFVSRQGFAPGEASLIFRLGYPPQTLEIGGVTLTNYDKKVRLRDLPGAPETYEPSQPGDAWRKAALARIERIRKADLTVAVTDADGKPVAGADVAVKMTHHAFGFGAAINAGTFKPDKDTPDTLKYREMTQKLFNRVVVENSFKWPGWENADRRRRVLWTLAWLRERGIEVRDHCLVWPSWKHMPRDVQQLKDDKAALQRRILDHIREEVAATKGRIAEWDVINEPFSNHDAMDVLGREAMVAWFQAAREADPAARLFINDYGILARSGRDRRHQDHYYETIRFLIDRGAPLDGIGLQSHFGGDLTPPPRLLAILDRFAAFTKALAVTEFDINVKDEELQAAYTRDFLTAVFSHPAVNGILMWGFWEGRHWRPQAALFRRDWSVKPNGRAWQDLVFKEWWTDVAARTDAQGRATVRGFLGDYEVTATAGDRSKTVSLALRKAGASATVRLGR